MKQTLVIGSTCADVIVQVPHLPTRGEDVEIFHQELRLGGCAYNVSSILRHFKIPCTLCSPVGTGIYGDFVRNELQKQGIPIFYYNANVPNGCCYCLVDDSGERSFLCEHGAEYLFDKNNFSSFDLQTVDSIFICGLELEEKTAPEEISFLEKCDKTIYFAPGPRICTLDKNLLERIFLLHPFLHLNETEALSFTKTTSVKDAAFALYKKNSAPLVITLGSKGAFYFSSPNDFESVPAFKTVVKDTIGAGDAHFGSIIAGLKQKMPLKDAVLRANKVSAAIVGVKGSTLSKSEFKNIRESF